MSDKAPPTPAIEDISAAHGVLPADRVYRSANGYKVKVTTHRHPSEDPLRLHFRFVAEMLEHDGAPIVGAHVLTVQCENAVQLQAEIDAARHMLVGRVETAALHHAAAAALDGVGDAP